MRLLLLWLRRQLLLLRPCLRHIVLRPLRLLLIDLRRPPTVGAEGAAIFIGATDPGTGTGTGFMTAIVDPFAPAPAPAFLGEFEFFFAPIPGIQSNQPILLRAILFFLVT